MFVYNQDVLSTPCEPGVTRKILCYSEELMMCEIYKESTTKKETFILIRICRSLI